MRPTRRCPDRTKLAHAAGFWLQSKLRLDAYLAAKLPTASRARLQASIKEGLVVVNGRQQVRGPVAASTPPAERPPCLVASMPMNHLRTGCPGPPLAAAACSSSHHPAPAAAHILACAPWCITHCHCTCIAGQGIVRSQARGRHLLQRAAAAAAGGCSGAAAPGHCVRG